MRGRFVKKDFRKTVVFDCTKWDPLMTKVPSESS